MPSILFVCTANQFRSPLAAAYMRAQLDRAGMSAGWIVESAGTWTETGSEISPRVRRAFHDLAIDLEGHTPRPVNSRLMRQFDLVLVMEAGQKEALQAEFPFARGRVFLLSEVTEGMAYDIPDPARVIGCTFEATAGEIRNLIRSGFLSICSTARRLSEQGTKPLDPIDLSGN